MGKIGLIIIVVLSILAMVTLFNQAESPKAVTAAPASVSEKDLPEMTYRDKSQETKIPTHHSDQPKGKDIAP